MIVTCLLGYEGFSYTIHPGAASICVGSTVTETSTALGGTWSSSNPAVATIGVSSGVVTGISPGTAVMAFNAGRNAVTFIVTVTACCLTNSLVINTGYNPLTDSVIPAGSNGGTPVPDPRWNVYNISPNADSAISFAGNIAVTFLPSAHSADVINGATVTGGSGGDTSGWDNDATNSHWISCQNDVKYRTYDTATYDMTLGRPFAMCSDDDIVFDLNIADDNIILAGDAYVDDITTPLSFGQIAAAPPAYTQYFTTFTHFSETLHLSAGTHILYFVVKNYSRYHGSPNPTGLNLYGTLSSVSGNSLVKENDTACRNYSCSHDTLHTTTAQTMVQTSGELVCFPNPNNGSFTLRGALTNTSSSNEASIDVMDMMGRIVYHDAAAVTNGGVNKTILLGDIGNGIYLIRVVSDNSSRVIRVSVNR